MTNTGTETEDQTLPSTKPSWSTIDFGQGIFSWLKNHQVLFQAILVWIIICLPGNVVTLAFYVRLHYYSPTDTVRNRFFNKIYFLRIHRLIPDGKTNMDHLPNTR